MDELKAINRKSMNLMQTDKDNPSAFTFIPQNGGGAVEVKLSMNALDEYDIIKSESSEASSKNSSFKLNGHKEDGKQLTNVRYSIIDVNTLNNEPRYIISKGYTAKRKDEIFLPLGTVVGELDKKDNRSYVVAFTKNGEELDRGWVPSFCLQLREEATEITSKEGLLLTYIWFFAYSER